ncbi:NAD(P)-dependent oxidoreductase [Cytophagaceae bacterium DM2B3-1]|uniref:NAD(P)-dependent oxidoreductase n=1 Tax=Xanthocytophaga flava TaxID=3048013 RepID=A0ABT7CLA3_9BACT|nr:NAD(P)-dependent oxidoreductase [Xanthocytophaga flavus]MDJ1494472.1 NAD(P)-dependent oxidoreductase [Xanthocytophaga flavus]
MRIAIIGASGFVGSHLLTEALQRDHYVTAIVRHPEKITTHHPHLIVKACDIMNTEALVPLLADNDAVLSAYNPGWTNPAIYEDFLKGSKSIQEATKMAGVKRLLTIGGAGSLYVAPDTQLIDTPQFPAEWKPGALAARDYLNIIKEEKDIEWTFLSPAIEMHAGTSGKRTGQYRTGTDNPVFDANGTSRISAEDLAVALIDELENKQFPKQRFTVAY